MRVIQKTELSAMTGVEMATTDEVLQVVIHKTVIAYLVPPAIWLDLKRDAEAEQGAADG